MLQNCQPEAMNLFRKLAKMLLLTVFGAAPLLPQAPRPPGAVLEEIRAHHKGIALWWMGNSGWLIKSDDLLIGTDR